ncbi:HdeD family acid-resistance protein [Mangrovicella endophytica]|uniref:HdeD family acid-resistance protein n=1 Tax=Mangrovicella endophytica TaxID=2066697 RepID=UPI000C9E2E63|nr:HdeD family acid-resistance protein [Mangrovicella endophytica]
MILPTTPRTAALKDAERRARAELHDHWKAYTFQGVLMIVMGILAILVPFAATLASTLFFGWLLLIGGVLGTIGAIRARGRQGFWSNLLLAVLVAVLGLVIIVDPLAGSVTLTWMLALYFLLSGLINITAAQALRTSTRRFWLLVLSGVLDLVLAGILILGLPGTAIWAVGLFIGISLLSSGIALLMAALDARKGPPNLRG